MPAVGRRFMSNLELTVPTNYSWTKPVPANERRVSIVSTAAVSRRGDKPFSWLAKDSRTIHKTDRDLVMTHVAVEFDRSAWQQDLNTIIPLDRLEEMAADGEIASVADEHYSFMGCSRSCYDGKISTSSCGSNEGGRCKHGLSNTHMTVLHARRVRAGSLF